MSSHFTRFDSARRIFMAIWLTASLAGLSGCIIAAAGAGAGAVAYVRGDLEANLDANPEQVVAAARKAATDLNFAPLSENREPLRVVLTSRTPLDKKVEITVSNSANKLTNMKIRVGVFGDEQVSRSILTKIKARL
jgi:hypothetical protein